MNMFEKSPEESPEESSAPEQGSLEAFREVLQRITDVENLRHTRELMVGIAEGRIDPEDPKVLELLDERIRELEV